MRRIVRGAARLWFRVRGRVATRIRGEAFWTDPDHLGFWRDVAGGRWEPELLDAIRGRLRPDSVYVDVGAWIGPTVLFAARRCRKVYCFEPDPDAYRYLLWNLHLNGLRNVVPLQAALGAGTGIRRLVSPEGGLGDSKATLRPAPGAKGGTDVPCLRWSDWTSFDGVERPDFIKMDIEGGEFELVPSMADYLRRERPALHLSIHGPVLPEPDRVSAVASLIEALRHYSACYREDGSRVDVEQVRRDAATRFCSFLFADETP